MIIPALPEILTPVAVIIPVALNPVAVTPIPRNPVTDVETPEEEIGKMMRRVISHEIGHALGLPHNMKASSAYPVDSLRSGRFTKKMGIPYFHLI